MGRRREPRIIDPHTHPRREVSLTVAAAYLGMDPRSVRARLDDGTIPAWRDGKIYRISVAALQAYHERRTELPT